MARRRLLRILVVLLAVAGVQGLVAFAILSVERERERPKPSFLVERVSNQPADDLLLMYPDGSRRSLRELQGKTIVLHFWATWCPPCREELPHLLELGRDLAKDGQILVVAVSLDTGWSPVRDFFGGKVPPEIVLTTPRAATEHYGVSTLPDTYVIDTEGSLRLRFAGARDWRTRLARETLGEVMEAR